MTTGEVLAALDLPPGCRVEQRIPKKLLGEQGAATAPDRRQVQEAIESLVWVAALKPATIGVPELRDGAREIVEIAVLRLTLRSAAPEARLTTLVHRAVPYPVLLVAEGPGPVTISLALKRRSQAEADRFVLERDVTSVTLSEDVPPDRAQAFAAALSLSRQPRADLGALYQGWVDTLLALHAARIAGTFTPPRSAAHAAERREALDVCRRLEARIADLARAADTERQIGRRVELNLELTRLRAEHAAAAGRLVSSSS